MSSGEQAGQEIGDAVLVPQPLGRQRLAVGEDASASSAGPVSRVRWPRRSRGRRSRRSGAAAPCPTAFGSTGSAAGKRAAGSGAGFPAARARGRGSRRNGRGPRGSSDTRRVVGAAVDLHDAVAELVVLAKPELGERHPVLVEHAAAARTGLAPCRVAGERGRDAASARRFGAHRLGGTALLGVRVRLRGDVGVGHKAPRPGYISATGCRLAGRPGEVQRATWFPVEPAAAAGHPPPFGAGGDLGRAAMGRVAHARSPD